MTRSRSIATPAGSPARPSADVEDRPATHRSIASRRWARVVLAAILPLAILVLWQVSTSLGWFTVVQLPSPGMVLAAGAELVQRGTLGGFILISTQRVLVGFAIGAALGMLLGAVTGLARTWDIFFGSTLGAIRAVPSPR